MSNTQHTPGPWKWHKLDPAQSRRDDSQEDSHWNALQAEPLAPHAEAVLTYSLMDKEALVFCRQANARLIAAAPDLLADFELVQFAAEEPWRHAGNSEGPTYQAMLQALAGIKQLARAAIAKATDTA